MESDKSHYILLLSGSILQPWRPSGMQIFAPVVQSLQQPRGILCRAGMRDALRRTTTISAATLPINMSDLLAPSPAQCLIAKMSSDWFIIVLNPLDHYCTPRPTQAIRTTHTRVGFLMPAVASSDDMTERA